MSIYLINLTALFLLHLLFYQYKNIKFENIIWIFVIFLLTIFIGFRYEIGGDWIHYKLFYYDINNLSFTEMLNSSLVYVVINKIAYYSGTQFIGVNFICAIIFMFSLSNFLKRAKNRWLALAISFPILILILGMGYTRQGLAFSFCLFLIRALEDKKLFKSIIFIILSVFSHKSALFFSSILFFLFLWYHKKYFYLLLSILIPIFFAYLFQKFYNHLFYYYVGSGQHMFSYGSIPRSLSFLFIAILFLVYKNKFSDMSKYQIFIYTSFSWVVIFLFPFSFTTSIVVDRLLLYLYPLKLVIISHANLKGKIINFSVFIIFSMYFFYLIIWIYFGKNSFSWVPYKFLGF